jgi:hypothetical protein
MQRGGRAVDRDGVLGANALGDGCLKARDNWALRQEIRPEYGHNRFDIGLVDRLATIGDSHRRSGSLFRVRV